MGRDDTLWHIWQVAPNAGWSHWESLGKPRDLVDGSDPPQDRDRSEPFVQKNADGHLEVFAPGNEACCQSMAGALARGADQGRLATSGLAREATATA